MVKPCPKCGKVGVGPHGLHLCVPAIEDYASTLGVDILQSGTLNGTFKPGPGFASLFGNYADWPEGEQFVREISLPTDLDAEFGEHPPRIFHEGP